MNNLKYIDDDEDISELMRLMEFWCDNKFEIKRPNPFEINIEMYYKDWGNISTIKYNIHSNKFRCKSTAGRCRQLKNTEAIRKQLTLIYTKFTTP